MRATCIVVCMASAPLACEDRDRPAPSVYRTPEVAKPTRAAPPFEPTPIPPAVAGPLVEPAPTPPVTPSVVAVPTGPPGPAYLAIAQRKGIVRLDSGRFIVLPGSVGKLVHALQIGGDGQLWALGEDLMTLRGDAFERVAPSSLPALEWLVFDFAVTAHGEIWASSFVHIGRWNGKTWALTHREAFGADDITRSIAVGATGEVLALTRSSVHVKSGDAWRAIDFSAFAGRCGGPLFDSVRVTPDGAAYVLTTSGLLRIEPGGGAVTEVWLTDAEAEFTELTMASNGSLAAMSQDDVIGLPAGGTPRRWAARDGKELRADNLRAVGVDDRGRVWVSADNGVTVLGPGDEQTEWPLGSVPELMDRVDAIAVAGAGPELPLAGRIRTGALTGKLAFAGSPLAHAEFELCPHPRGTDTVIPCPDAPLDLCPAPPAPGAASPCAAARTRFTGKTDDRGVWTIRDVPLGQWGVAAKIDDRWWISAFPFRVGQEMKEGELLDCGLLRFDETNYHRIRGQPAPTPPSAPP